MLAQPSNHKNTFLTLMLSLVFLVSTSGCGTEVGNGWSTGEDETSTKRNPQQDVPAQDGASPGSINDGPQQSKSDIGDNSSGDEFDQGNGAQETTTEMGYSYRYLDLMTASCGSLFAGDLASPIELENESKTETISAEWDSPNTRWALKYNGSFYPYYIKEKSPKTTDHEINKVNSNGTVISDGFSCSAVAKLTGQTISGVPGSFTLYSLTVSGAGSDANVAWYILENPSDKDKLQRLEITEAGKQKQIFNHK